MSTQVKKVQVIEAQKLIEQTAERVKLAAEILASYDESVTFRPLIALANVAALCAMIEALEFLEAAAVELEPIQRGANGHK